MKPLEPQQELVTKWDESPSAAFLGSADTARRDVCGARDEAWNVAWHREQRLAIAYPTASNTEVWLYMSD